MRFSSDPNFNPNFTNLIECQTDSIGSVGSLEGK